MKKLTIVSLVLLALAGILFGMTVNGSLDVLGTLTAAVVNFGSSTSTAPNKIGTSAPGTCTVGQTFFDSDATAGSNLLLCTATDTWTAISGGSSSFDCTATTNLCLQEEFMGGATTTGSPVGNGALRNVAMGSGGILYQAGENNHLGIIRLDNSSATGSGIWLGFAASGGNGSASMVNWYSLYNNDWDLTWVAKVTTTADIRFRAGFDKGMSYGGSYTSSSMWIRYDTVSPFDDDAKASGAGAWVAQICGYDDSGSNCTTSGTAGLTAELAGTVDTNWHTFHIYHANSKIYFQVDSGATKTACLSGGGCDMTLPANPGYGLTNYVTTPAIIFTAEATGSKSAYVDAAKFKVSGLSR